MKDIRICSVETNGPIKELGNISGPVRKCRLELPKILSMINNGHVIYELNPENLSERVKLDLTNASPSPFTKKVEYKPEPVHVSTEGFKSEGIIKEEKYEINTSHELTGIDKLVKEELVVEKVVEVQPEIKNNYNSNNSSKYEKYDKKNKHKHHNNNNQNYNKQNVQNNTVNVETKPETTVEEKVVSSDF